MHGQALGVCSATSAAFSLGLRKVASTPNYSLARGAEKRSTNLTDDPANELAVIERLASGQHRLWVYSEVADDLDRIALGVLPVLTFDQSDFDGDGLQDLLFVDNGVDDGYDATLPLSSTQRVQSFELGSQFAYVFGDYVDVNYFSVVLDDAEFDRGPVPEHYPPSWFD